MVRLWLTTFPTCDAAVVSAIAARARMSAFSIMSFHPVSCLKPAGRGSDQEAAVLDAATCLHLGDPEFLHLLLDLFPRNFKHLVTPVPTFNHTRSAVSR